MLRKSVLSACNAVAFKTKRFGEWIVGGVGGIAKGKIRIQINIMLGESEKTEVKQVENRYVYRR